MNTLQKVLTGIAVVLAIIFAYEYYQVKKAEAGPAHLMQDVRDHTFGGAPRADLEAYFSKRGGAVDFEPEDGSRHSYGVDHVTFRNIRHLGESREDLKVDLHYDQGDHLIYYTMRRVWIRPNQK